MALEVWHRLGVGFDRMRRSPGSLGLLSERCEQIVAPVHQLAALPAVPS
jgi:hypothetical protein